MSKQRYRIIIIAFALQYSHVIYVPKHLQCIKDTKTITSIHRENTLQLIQIKYMDAKVYDRETEELLNSGSDTREEPTCQVGNEQGKLLRFGLFCLGYGTETIK